MKELLINNDFDVIDLNGILRVFYNHGECFKTLTKLREIIPNKTLNVSYGYIDIIV